MKKGISDLRDLEKLTGISHTKLWRIENKKKSPTLDELKQIAVALEIYIEDLYDDDFKRHPNTTIP